MAYITSHKELRVYQMAFSAAMEIFELSKAWPAEERYSLTDQIRRSSRSVCGNIAAAWRKRRYPNHFASRLTDADSEVAETENWLDFAQACGYLTVEKHAKLWDTYEQVTRGLVGMVTHADDWCLNSDRVRETLAAYLVDTEL